MPYQSRFTGTQIDEGIAASRTLMNQNIGANDLPVYFVNGQPVQCDTIGLTATAASQLSNMIKINGTDFNGTTDIVTGKWGESRAFIVKDYLGIYAGEALAVDGSADCIIKMPSVIKAERFEGTVSNADFATKAQQDSLGNIIADTYLPLEGGVMAANKKIYFGNNAAYIDATDYTGTAATATRLTGPGGAGIKITLAGDVKGAIYDTTDAEVNVDGSTDFVITTQVDTDNYQPLFAGSEECGGAANKVAHTLVLKIAGTEIGRFDGSEDLEFNTTLESLNISKTMQFMGMVDAASNADVVEGSSVSTIKINGADVLIQNGQVVIKSDGSEYVWDGAHNKWCHLGQDQSFALSTVTITGDNDMILGGGDLTNNRSFSHKTSTVVATTYGNVADKTLSSNDSFYVPTFTVDMYGHLTAASNKVMTMPDSINRLTNPRKINDTEFDGTSDITTVKWGTSRRFAIADESDANTGTESTVDGSRNITLHLPSTIAANLTGSIQTEQLNNGTLFVAGVVGQGYSPMKYNSNITINCNDGILNGAAWNDVAEFRKGSDEAGRVVCETGDGELKRSVERLQPGARIVSDTYGFTIGWTFDCGLPIAISGRVLAYTYEDRNEFAAGDPVCAGPDGTISKMTREEVKEYPDRMIGTVSEIPTYETWNDGKVKVKDRIWVYIR